jgi:hypothetical protein
VHSHSTVFTLLKRNRAGRKQPCFGPPGKNSIPPTRFHHEVPGPTKAATFAFWRRTRGDVCAEPAARGWTVNQARSLCETYIALTRHARVQSPPSATRGARVG